jgi:glycosyltransferase involved in cell wall biosynthesis
MIAMSLISPTTGVPRKVLELVEGLSAQGHEVRLLPLSPLTPPQRSDFSRFLNGDQGERRRFPRRFGLVGHIRRQVRQYAPDIVYYRYQTSVWHWLGLRASGAPWVQEHNTIEIHELDTAANRRARRVERWIGGQFRRDAAGLIGVTAEVLAHQRRIAGRDGPGLVLPNSIAAVAPAATVRFPASRRIVMVSRFAPWHGLDRALDLMERPEMARFRLHVVGTGPPVDELASRIERAPNATWEGNLEGAALDRLIQSCDLALGALALHRKGMTEACPIKVRQYLSLGVPVVFAHSDPDLPGDLPFVLRVPEGDGPIPAELILDFHRRLEGDPTVPSLARDHARRVMLLAGRLPSLVRFFKGVLESGHSGGG